jgi:RNA polymerase sigma factor (sigma-70 family)
MTRTPPWYTRLIKVCQRLGRSLDEAEDLVQDAYVRLLEYRRSKDIRSEEALLSRIVANLAINQYHRERAQTSESLDDIEEEGDLIDESPGIDRILAAQDRLREVERTLNRVSERTRQIFVAHRAGFSYEEIAAEFGISRRTVQKHIVRATVLLGMRPSPPSRF